YLLWGGHVQSLSDFFYQEFGEQEAGSTHLFPKGVRAVLAAQDLGDAGGEGLGILLRVGRLQAEDGVTQALRRSVLMFFETLPCPVQKAGPPLHNPFLIRNGLGLLRGRYLGKV